MGTDLPKTPLQKSEQGSEGQGIDTRNNPNGQYGQGKGVKGLGTGDGCRPESGAEDRLAPALLPGKEYGLT